MNEDKYVHRVAFREGQVRGELPAAVKAARSLAW